MADQEKIASFLEQSASTDIPVLLKAKEDAKRQVNTDPSPANLAALDRASRMLREAMSAQQGSKNFINVAEILDYLKEQGRKASRAQIYKDLRLGHLLRQKDGTFRRLDVDRYAQTLKAFALPEQAADEVSGLALDEAKERVGKLRAQRQALEFDRAVKQGKYIKREEVAAELAARAATLSVGLRSVFRIFAPELIALVGGDKNKADEMAEAYEHNLDAALNEFSRPMEFSVEYIPDDINPETMDDEQDESAEATNEAQE